MIFSPLNMYQYLMDALPSNIIIFRPALDGEDFIFLDINSKVEQTENIERSEMIGKRLTELFPQVAAFGLLEALKRVFKTGLPEILEPRLYEDGKIQGWRKNEVRLLPNGDLLVIYEDYSDRKKTEKKLLSLGHIIDDSINEIYIFDKETLKFTYLNNGALNNIGYRFDEMRELTPLDIQPNHDAATFSTLLKPLYSETIKQLVFETVYRRKDGTTYKVEARLQLMKIDEKEQIVAFVSDITERKKLQEDLHQKVQELTRQTHLLKHYKETIDKNTLVSMTDENGFITSISEAYEKVSGYSKHEVIGRTHAIFRHPDTPKQFYTDMWKILNSGQSWDGEVKNRGKDGNAYWLRLHIEHERDAHGNLTGYSAIGHDITNRIRLEALTKELEHRVATEVERNRLQTIQMLEQSRLAQMGEMISMIAHQWRQPLASVAAISSTLTLDVMMDNYKKDFFEERLEAISDLAQHLSSTIDDFRNFFKEHKEKTDTTWKMIIEGSLSIIEPTFHTHNITVERLDSSDEILHTYANEIRQVLLNIFKNAEDVFLEKATENATIWIKCHTISGMSCLTIEDNGGGIPEKLLSKIFDPYFSTKEKKDGTGLGLYMSKMIVEEHCKGKLTVSNTSQGACFEIALPL